MQNILLRFSNSRGILTAVCIFVSLFDKNISAWNYMAAELPHCNFQKVGRDFQGNFKYANSVLIYFYISQRCLSSLHESPNESQRLCRPETNVIPVCIVHHDVHSGLFLL